MKPRQAFTGPALFSYGFRPFFAATILTGLIAVPLWVLIWQGALDYNGPFAAVDWHIHEMVFGYGSAVLAGFLFTAVPNWTGRLPVRGWPLAALFALWILGRLVLWTGFVGPIAALLIDCAFLVLVAAMIAREIVAGKNWRNLKVLLPVSLFTLANLCFHLEVMSAGISDYSRRLGIALLIFLIMLIGGRIIPSFTRNWLVKTRGQEAPLPVPFSRFDGVSLAFGAVALLAWVLLPGSLFAAVFLMIAGVLHMARLTRWRGSSVLSSAILLMLHLAYGFIPLGLFVAGFAALGLMDQAAAVNILGIGGIGGMTVAVMMRASMGHTGRDLTAGPLLTLAFALLCGAAALRSADSVFEGFEIGAIHGAAALWTLAFALVSLRLLPWLVQGNAAKRKASAPPQARPSPQ